MYSFKNVISAFPHWKACSASVFTHFGYFSPPPPVVREQSSFSPLLHPTHIACCWGYTSGHCTYSWHNLHLCDRLNELTCRPPNTELIHSLCKDAVLAHEEPESSVRFTCPWVRTASATVACQRGGAVTGWEDLSSWEEWSYEDNSECYESDYVNEDDSLTRGVHY